MSPVSSLKSWYQHRKETSCDSTQGDDEGNVDAGVGDRGLKGDDDADDDNGPQEIVAGVAGRERRRNFGINTYLGADEEVIIMTGTRAFVAGRQQWRHVHAV